MCDKKPRLTNTATADLVCPSEPGSGSALTAAYATALLKQVNDAPLTGDEQALLQPACQNCANCRKKELG